MTLLSLALPLSVLTPGQPLQGQIHLMVEGFEPQTLEPIHLSLTGVEHVLVHHNTQTTVIGPQGNSSTAVHVGPHNRTTHEAQKTIFQIQSIVAPGRVWAPGQHVIDFSVPVPGHQLPPSFEIVRLHASVQYSVKAWIPRGFLKRDYKDEKRVWVLPTPCPQWLPPLTAGDSKTFFFAAGALSGQLEMPSALLPPGVQVGGTISVTNRSSLHVSGVRVVLQRKVRCGQHHHTDTVAQVALQGILSQETLHQQFSMLVPLDAPCTYQGSLLAVQYRMHCELVVDATFAANLHVSGDVTVLPPPAEHSAPDYSTYATAELASPPAQFGSSSHATYPSSSSANDGPFVAPPVVPLPPAEVSKDVAPAPSKLSPAAPSPMNQPFVLPAPTVAPVPTGLSPIYDITVVRTADGEMPPPSFVLVTRTIGGRPANLNADCKRDLFHLYPAEIFLAYTRQMRPGGPITDIGVYMPNEGDVLRPEDGWEVVQTTAAGRSANCNSGNKGTEIYLVCRRGQVQHGEPGYKLPIVDIQVMFESDGEQTPQGYERISRTVGDATRADLNRTAGGKDIFLSVLRQPQPDLQ